MSHSEFITEIPKKLEKISELISNQVELISNQVELISNQVENSIGNIGNNIVYLLVSLFLIFYITLDTPILPHFIIKLFSNILFRLIIILYILYNTNHDLKLSVLLTCGFLLIMYLINKQLVKEMFSNTSTCGKCKNKNCSCK
jgi:predicted PurR-regulated permease PerM